MLQRRGIYPVLALAEEGLDVPDPRFTVKIEACDARVIGEDRVYRTGVRDIPAFTLHMEGAIILAMPTVIAASRKIAKVGDCRGRHGPLAAIAILELHDHLGEALCAGFESDALAHFDDLLDAAVISEERALTHAKIVSSRIEIDERCR